MVTNWKSDEVCHTHDAPVFLTSRTLKQGFALNVTDPHQQGFFTLQTLSEAGFQKRLHQLGSVVTNWTGELSMKVANSGLQVIQSPSSTTSILIAGS